MIPNPQPGPFGLAAPVSQPAWQPRPKIPDAIPPLKASVVEPDASPSDYVGAMLSSMLERYGHVALAGGVGDNGPVWAAEVGLGEGSGNTASLALRRAEVEANKLKTP